MDESATDQLAALRATALERRRRECERLGVAEDASEMHLQLPQEPAFHLPSLKRALQFAAGRPLAGEFQVSGEQVTRGIGVATVRLVRWVMQRDGDSAPVASVFEKLIGLPENNEKHHATWFREAAVYADADFVRDIAGLRLPICHEIRVEADNRIRMYLEDLTDLPHPWKPHYRETVARKLGEFAGRGHGAGLWGRPWLGRDGDRIGLPKDIGRLESGLRGLVDSEEFVRTVYRQFMRLHGLHNPLTQLRNSLAPTVTHLDAHLSNLFVREDADDVIAIDWMRVSRGIVGDDMVRVLLPWNLMFRQKMRHAEYEEYSRALRGAYLTGVRLHAPQIDGADIELAIEIGAAYNCLSRLCDADRLVMLMEKMKPGRMKKLRSDICDFLAGMCESIDRLAGMCSR